MSLSHIASSLVGLIVLDLVVLAFTFGFSWPSRSFFSLLRVRPVFPAVFGFSWPSRSPWQVGSILGVFYPEPFFRYDVFVVSRASCGCLAFSS